MTSLKVAEVSNRSVRVKVLSRLVHNQLAGILARLITNFYQELGKSIGEIKRTAMQDASLEFMVHL